MNRISRTHSSAFSRFLYSFLPWPPHPFMRKSNRWFGPVGGAASCGGGLSRSLLEALKGSVSSQLQLESSVQLKRATLITISILGTG